MIYAASDLHGRLPVPPGDATLLLLVGDICPDFRPGGGNHWDFVDKEGFRQGRWLDTTFRAWLDACVDQNIEVVAIWGNHDFVGEHPGFVPDDLCWKLVQDEEVVVAGLRIYGTPWVPGLPYWAFHGTDRLLKLRAEALPSGLDILMTHGPPRGAGDYIPTSPKQREKYGNYRGEHVGDGPLRDGIKRARPRLTLCGHIHEARGEHSLDGLPVYNVAAVDELYRLHEEPWKPIYLDEVIEDPFEEDRPADAGLCTGI